VVVTHADRIVRNQVRLAVFLKEIEQHQAQLFCARETFDDTPIGRFLRTVLEFINETEREHADR
jgi:DNA invertase Pin-like site-specific DNA recombinase